MILFKKKSLEEEFSHSLPVLLAGEGDRLRIKLLKDGDRLRRAV